MKNRFSHVVTAPLVMLLCLLGLSSFSLAADPVPGGAGPTAKPAVSAAQAGPQVNINTASAEEIASKLKGIGLKKAQAIVAYREAHGQFTSKEGLTAVKGIGESTLQQNSELISLK